MKQSVGWLACAMAGLIVSSASGVVAQPMVLADADLDRTTAGSQSDSLLERLAGLRDRLSEYGISLDDVWGGLFDLDGRVQTIIERHVSSNGNGTSVERHVSSNGNGTSVVETHTVISHSYSSGD